MFSSGPKTIDFDILLPKGSNRKETLEALRSQGVEIIRENEKTSDYARCRTEKSTFCRIFDTKLKYKTLKVGSYELKKPGKIPAHLDIKSVLLVRDILLPYGFIQHHTIEKDNHPK